MRRNGLDWQDEQPAERQSTRSHASTDASTDASTQMPDDASQAMLLGESLAVRRLRSQVERIAPYFRKALVRGEAGSGKRLVARALHEFSAAGGPFVTCRALSVAEALAGDPASPEVTALVDSTRGGTLYLEEIGEVPFSLQAGLLGFVAEQAAGRSGEVDPSRTSRRGFVAGEGRESVRIVAGTVCDLRTMSAVGQFRPDLYAQIAAVELSAPALRQRAEDLPLLAEWIVRRVSRRTGLAAKVLSAGALAELARRAWGNNLRELEQVVTHAAALADGPVIEVRHLAPAVVVAAAGSSGGATAGPVTHGAERLQDVIHQHVVTVLTRCGGNKLRAAEVLGISRSTLYRMLDAGPAAEL